MTVTTKYNIGQRVKAKSPHRAKAEEFVITDIRTTTLCMRDSQSQYLTIEYRSSEYVHSERLGGMFWKHGNWYPEGWILGQVGA